MGIPHDVHGLGLVVRGGEHTSVLEQLKRIFGHGCIEELKAKVLSGRVMLAIRFDNGECVHCGNSRLVFTVPQGAKRIEQVISIPRRSPVTLTNAISEASRNRLDRIINLTEKATNPNDSEELDRLRGKINDLVGDVSEELMCGGVRGKELLDSITSSLGMRKDRILLKGPRSNGPDFLVEDTETKKVIAALEVKGTAKPHVLEHVLSKALVSLLDHFSKPEFKDLAVGFPVAVQFDPRQTLKTGEFQYMWSITMNPSANRSQSAR